MALFVKSYNEESALSGLYSHAIFLNKIFLYDELNIINTWRNNI